MAKTDSLGSQFISSFLFVFRTFCKEVEKCVDDAQKLGSLFTRYVSMKIMDEMSSTGDN